MKFILLLALVGCAVNVQVTAAAAINTFYGTDDADERYDAANAAPPSINAAANLAAAAPYPAAAASLNAADAVAKILPSDYSTRPHHRYPGNSFGGHFWVGLGAAFGGSFLGGFRRFHHHHYKVGAKNENAIRNLLNSLKSR